MSKPVVPPAKEPAEFAASLRRAIDAATGMIIGAASSCWENLAGAGNFQSQHASALIDLMLEYAGRSTCACQTTEQATHPLGDQAFCAVTGGKA